MKTIPMGFETEHSTDKILKIHIMKTIPMGFETYARKKKQRNNNIKIMKTIPMGFETTQTARILRNPSDHEDNPYGI